jgi:hypothetical protein
MMVRVTVCVGASQPTRRTVRRTSRRPELEVEVLEVTFPEVEVLVDTLPDVEDELPPVEVEVDEPPVEVEVELPLTFTTTPLLPLVVVVELTETWPPPLEPPMLVLFGMGALATFARRRKRKSAGAAA